jgi:hypothetical protein
MCRKLERLALTKGNVIDLPETNSTRAILDLAYLVKHKRLLLTNQNSYV